MFVKYFEYIVFVSAIFSIIIIVWKMFAYIKKKHFQKIVKISILRRQQKKGYATFYSSEIIDRVVNLLFNKNDKKSQEALSLLLFGRIDKTVEYLENINKTLSLFLQAHYDAKIYSKAINQKFSKKNKSDSIYASILAHNTFNHKKALQILEKTNPKKIKGKLKAYYLYISAFMYLQEADMMSASQNASQALEMFKKYNYFYEEAQCYLLLAEIYRVSCVNDIAQTMIESAIKIYEKMKLNYLHAQSMTVLGMLMLFENRFEEAEDKFNTALNLCNLSKIHAEIYNQKALLKIAQKKNKEAEKNAQEAFILHDRIKNYRGIAYSKQLLGHIYQNSQKYSKSSLFAQEASELYLKQKNYSAYMETLYLQASSLCKSGKYKKAEKLLRTILNETKNRQTSFHISNAYSLLGLIYLQTNNLQRAKVLFQQSLNLEQSNERCNALVADYTNLALIDEMLGNNDSAKNNLNVALEYAEKTEDMELITLVKDKVSII